MTEIAASSWQRPHVNVFKHTSTRQIKVKIINTLRSVALTVIFLLRYSKQSTFIILFPQRIQHTLTRSHPHFLLPLSIKLFNLSC